MNQNGHCENVRVTVSLTPDDIFRAEKTFFSKRKKAQQRRKQLIVILLLLPFTTYLFVWWYMRIMREGGWIDLEPAQVNFVTLVLVMGAATVAIAGISYLVFRRKKLQVHVQQGLKYRASLCTYSFGNEISIVTPSNESTVQYSEISEVIEDYYGYLIVPHTGALIYLPTRVLYGEELNAVKSMIARSFTEDKTEEKGV